MSASNIVTKGEFARLCNVDPTRVSHWIREGRISGDALDGSGRTARIVVDKARAQLRQRLDPNQMTGNGAGTIIDTGAVAPSPASAERSRAHRPTAATAATLPDVLWQLLGEVPGQVAWQTLGSGAGARAAFHAFHSTCMGLRFDLRIRAGVELPAGFFDVPNWTAIAAELGEEPDVEAWRVWTEDRLGADSTLIP